MNPSGDGVYSRHILQIRGLREVSKAKDMLCMCRPRFDFQPCTVTSTAKSDS